MLRTVLSWTAAQVRRERGDTFAPASKARRALEMKTPSPSFSCKHGFHRRLTRKYAIPPRLKSESGKLQVEEEVVENLVIVIEKTWK